MMRGFVSGLLLFAMPAWAQEAKIGEGMPTVDQFGNTFSDVPLSQRRRNSETDKTVAIRVEGAKLAEQGATLRGLDRIRGRTQDIDIAPGQTVIYERLEVTLAECRYPSGEENIEAFAYLTIRDLREDEAAFEGWMFASSPALSALDHPRYDVWVLSCRT